MASKLSVNLTENLVIDPLIMNASGVLSYPANFPGWEDYLGAFVLKSIGYEPRDGNETPVYRGAPAYTINAMGLNNPGREAVVRELEEYRDHLEKPLCASIFADTEEGFAGIAAELDPYVDFFEGNYSCPNIRPGEETGMEIGKDPERVKSYVRAFRDVSEKPFFAKFSPALHIYDHRNQSDINLIKVSESALRAGATGICAINTVPGGMEISIEARQPLLSARYGGVGGPGIKPVGIGAIYSLRKNLGDDVPLIGVGGITYPQDVLEYVMAGADAVQIGSHLRRLEREGTIYEIESRVETMGNFLETIEDWLEREGTALEEIRGCAVE